MDRLAALMTCMGWGLPLGHVSETRLIALVRGRLPAGPQVRVEAHLAHCAHCQARLATVQAVLKGAERLSPVDQAGPILDLADSIWRATDGARLSTPRAPTTHSGRVGCGWRWLSAAAALVLGLVIGRNWIAVDGADAVDATRQCPPGARTQADAVRVAPAWAAPFSLDAWMPDALRPVPEATVASRAVRYVVPAESSSSMPESSSILETTASVPERDLWREALAAYYHDRDFQRAITLAMEVLDEPTQRAAWPSAERMLCEARVTLEQGERAISACKRLLVGARTDDEVRRAHYMLASVYRRQLGDCQAAMPHFDRALIFGRTSVLDDEVRLSRAFCALEVGNRAVAEHDWKQLEARRAQLLRPQRLDELGRLLAPVRTVKPRGTKTIR